MPFVVVDTNNLMKDYQLSEGVMQAFLLGCRRCGIDIFFPDVVLDELIGNYERDITKATTQLSSSAKKLERMGVKVEAPKIDLKLVAQGYRKHLNDMIIAHDIGRIPYPTTTPKELVQASYAGKKPFKETGEGFKDYLICQSLANLAQEEGGDGFLVTANKKDFGGTDGKLHPDLALTLLKGCAITVFEDVQQFNETVLKQNLEALDGIASQIQKDEFEGFDLGEGLTSLFIQELCEKFHPLRRTGTGLDEPTVDSVGPAEVYELHVSKLSDNRLLFELNGSVELELTGFVDKRDYYSMESDDLYVVDADWNEHVLRASTSSEMHFTMTVVFGSDTHKAESVTVNIEPLGDMEGVED